MMKSLKEIIVNITDWTGGSKRKKHDASSGQQTRWEKNNV